MWKITCFALNTLTHVGCLNVQMTCCMILYCATGVAMSTKFTFHRNTAFFSQVYQAALAPTSYAVVAALIVVQHHPIRLIAFSKSDHAIIVIKMPQLVHTLEYRHLY